MFKQKEGPFAQTRPETADGDQDMAGVVRAKSALATSRGVKALLAWLAAAAAATRSAGSGGGGN